MTTMTFDKLAYVDRLRAAGFNDPQARAMADSLDQALREEVATKSDVAVLKSGIESDIAALRNEIGLLRVEVKSDLGTLKSEFRAELGGLRSEFRAELGGLRGELGAELGGLRGELGAGIGGLRGELLAAMKADKIDLLKWVVMLIVGQTAVFTALKLLGR
jgi:hypothetical protein